MESITEADVRRALDGDRSALSAILKRLERPFYNLAIRMLRSPHDAEDAAQECLVRVATRLSQFDGRAKFSTWAWKVAVRRILDLRAGAGAELRTEQFGADLAEGLEPQAPERPDERVELGELKMRCGRALLLCLDPDDRIAFVLGEIFDLDAHEAGEIVGIEPATFRKRLSRARERLREALNAHCGVVNPSAACRCHRRLTRARQLGRVAPGEATTERPLDVRVLHERLQQVSDALRAAEYYRADPASLPRRDLVRAALDPLMAV